MFKLKKLNSNGFAHHFLVAIVVVGVAVVGTYYLVASHADTCGGMSDPQGTSCQPVTAPEAQTLACTTSGIPTSAKPGQSITPVVTIKNTSTVAFAPTLISYFVVENASGPAYEYTKAQPSLEPGQSETVTLPKYTVKAAYSSSYKFDALVTPSGSTGSTCDKTFNVVVPTTKQVTINPDNWILVHAAITTNAPKGNVVKMTTTKTTSSTLNSSTTSKGLTTSLAKLSAFTDADLGKSVQLCVSAKSDSSSNASLSVDVNQMSKSSVSKTLKFSNKYSNQCFNYTVSSNRTYALDPQVFISDYDESPSVFVDVVTITLN